MENMESMDIDPEVARRLLEEGGTLVAAGAPRGTYIGIDLQCWRIDSEFRGIKMIPPGLHFVHYSASDLNTGDDAPRLGFMHNFKQREMLVKIWDKEKEDFSHEIADEETVQRFRDNLYNLDKFLAPYPYEVLKKWISLSAHITEPLAAKFTPENGKIRSALELISCNDKDRPKGEKRKVSNSILAIENGCEGSSESTLLDNNVKCDESKSTPTDNCDEKSENENKILECDDRLSGENVANDKPRRRTRTLTIEEKEEELLPHLKPTPGTFLRFSTFPDKNYPDDATPSEITKHYLDQSYALELMMRYHNKPMDLVGELEFAYVCFLIGHSLDAFEHWKKLVRLFCSCEEAIIRYRNVYMHFITTLQVQLMEIPEEFLADIVMNENVIYVILRSFFKTVQSSKVESRLKVAIERFQCSLTEKFMWNFANLDDDEDDELPVIVHL
ncbi:protein AAR2 homolog [Arctopsyche grandis]|uniref:protein AAR2 homolog n=1 Tax=Arctopsyche grandis TaxID=121162 RepID=UPI00406D8090